MKHEMVRVRRRSAAGTRMGGGIVLQAEKTVHRGGIRGETTGKAAAADTDRVVQRVDEPRLRLGIIEKGTDGGRSGVRLRGEQEEADSRGSGGIRVGVEEAIVLFDHVIEIFISGDRDEGIKVLVGELVLEGEGAVAEKGPREASTEIGEGGVAIDDDDARLTTKVAERFVGGPGDYMAAIAAHEAKLGCRRRGGEGFVPGLTAAGARRRIHGVCIADNDASASDADGGARIHRR